MKNPAMAGWIRTARANHGARGATAAYLASSVFTALKSSARNWPDA